MGDFQNPSPDAIRRLLESTRRIAVVGLSANPRRPSHSVSAYMKSQGYEIVPVNPTVDECLGEPAYANLLDIPEPVDMVNVFRRPEHVADIVRDAIAIGAKSLWLQDGVIDETAALKAVEAGITVVMDRCLFRDHSAMVAGE